MFNDLSDRVQTIKPSPTLAVSALATQLRSQGRDIIGLGTGEPDFDTPEHIKDAAIKAIHDGKTKYTAVDGTSELKQAVINKFERDNGFQYRPEQILVSSGGKQSFYNLCQALLNKGDEVIIPAPYWVSYPDMVLLAEGKPVIVETTIDQQFKISAESLKQAITDRTRMFVINSPSNPSGVAYTKKELETIAEVLLEYPDILVVTDDMYEHILWSKEGFSNILNASGELYDRCMVLNGVSKAYAMTGWRIGYAAGPADIIKAMKKIQSQSTSNPCSISQAAAVAALNGDQSCIQTMLKAFKERHDFVVKSVNATPNMHCTPSDGTFYSFVNIQPFIDSRSDLSTDVEVANLLLDQVGVALVPGSAFGSPGHMRLSFATSMQNLQSAMDRINQVFSEK